MAQRTHSTTLGIVGAGKLGIVLAQLALKAGLNVYLSGSESPSKIALTAEVLAPGAIAVTTEELAKKTEVIILALPLGKYKTLNPSDFKGKLVIDAMNYWWEADGERSDLSAPGASTSELVQAYVPDARVVKAFNHMGYHDLFDEPKAVGQPGRKAIAIAGNSSADVKAVAALVNQLGFDPLPIGALKEGVHLQPGGKVFGTNLTKPELQALLPNMPRTDGLSALSVR